MDARARWEYRRRQSPDAILGKILEAEGDRISVQRIMLGILAQFKGADGFADAWKKCFDHTEYGNPTQVRMLSDAMRGFALCSSESDDFDDVEPEDLQAIIREVTNSTAIVPQDGDGSDEGDGEP